MNNSQKFLLSLALSASMGTAFAGDITVAGSDRSGFISRTPNGLGLGTTVDYVYGNDKSIPGSASAGAIGLTFAIPVSKLTVGAGAKAAYFDADGHGAAPMLGAFADLAVTDDITVFASSYWAPEGWATGSIERVSDNRIGARWYPIPLVGIEVGWREFSIERTNKARNAYAIDGSYLGLVIGF
ncbi:MAG: YfaZ family protein [Neisseriaceae bacterium]|nr:YfaZ family protein [Neisseriaceae bacterium]